jgi:DNA polymerase-3 subunit epsilon
MLELAVDCETTGLGSHDRIVSLAVVSVGRFVEGANYRFEFNPGRPSHPKAFEKHGLSDGYLATKPPFAQMAAALHELLSRADLIVAHNAAFDMKMLDREFGMCGLAPIAVPVFCTMRRAREVWPDQSASLDSCLARIGLSRAGAVHAALEDAMLASLLYLHFTGRSVPQMLSGAPASASPPEALDAQSLRSANRFLFAVFAVLAIFAVALGWILQRAPAPEPPRAAAIQSPPAYPAPRIAGPDTPSGRRPLTREEIVELQQKLVGAGFAIGAADGVAGSRTRAALRSIELLAGWPQTDSGATVAHLEWIRAQKP